MIFDENRAKYHYNYNYTKKRNLNIPSNKECIFCLENLCWLPKENIVICCESSKAPGCNMGFCLNCIKKYLQEFGKNCPGCRSENILCHPLLSENSSEISDEISYEWYIHTSGIFDQILSFSVEEANEYIFSMLAEDKQRLIATMSAYLPEFGLIMGGAFTFVGYTKTNIDNLLSAVDSSGDFELQSIFVNLLQKKM
jgi:hypothetical protein